MQEKKQIRARERIFTDYGEIRLLVERLREKKIKIVLTQGSFDMVHIGHGRYLEEAKRYGDLLIVGVDNDEKIKHRKGPDRPIVPEDERLEMLTYIRSVDVVFCKKLGDPKWHLIKAIEPDVLITIDENYSDEERLRLKQFCGEVIVLDRQATTSTSAKLRFMQIGVAEKLGRALTPKLISAVQEAMYELHGKPEERNTVVEKK